MPAEWAPHQATWMSWPHKRESWPGKFAAIEPIIVKMVKALARSETVRINVLDESHEGHVRSLCAGISGTIEIHCFPTNDAWCRDYGAVFVTRPGGNKLAAIDFEYNAWGEKYPPYHLDNAIPARMAEALAVPCYKADFILEGGSIDVSGTGLALTTEQCLLNPNRNPHLNRAEIEWRLRVFLGIEKVLWLGEGILGDDTDGHVDDLTRFVSADTAVTVVEEHPDDDNFAPLEDNLARLRTMTDIDGRPLTIKTLPMPTPVYYDGTRLPASYANFYIANRVVLVPFFNDRMDAAATDIIQSCFPGREIVGIDCTDLVWGLGAFHCLTQQVPAV